MKQRNRKLKLRRAQQHVKTQNAKRQAGEKSVPRPRRKQPRKTKEE